MTGWVPYVFVRVVVCFAAGILLGMYCPEVLGEPLAMGLLAVGVVAYAAWFIAAQRFALKPTSFGWVALPMLVLAGYLSLLLHTGSRRSDHFMGQEGTVDYYEAVLTQDPQVRETRYRAEARIIRVHAGRWRDVSGNVLLYFAKDTAAAIYHYGDVFLVRGHPQPVAAPANPGAFDYRRYLANRGIYHQQFLNTTAVRRVDHQSSLMDYAMTLRRWSARVIKENIQGAREQATAMALVLGVTDALDDDLLQAYAATGAMHVLAVSGLHISVLYFIIAFIFRPLQRWRHGPWLLAAASILLLWGYAFVTALSPSVLRAVVMFTFVSIATAAKRNTNTYNTLAAAAFCLLLMDPYMLLSVGFQLSFLAVAGIMVIHPLLFARWEPRHRWVSEVWKVTSVSIAAQLATFPLGLAIILSPVSKLLPAFQLAGCARIIRSARGGTGAAGRQRAVARRGGARRCPHLADQDSECRDIHL
jgi:competence protein ComEC